MSVDASAAPASSGERSIRRLQLTNFRSYEQLDLRAEKRLVLIVGPNGSGKTNILEGLSLLSPGRGLRRAGADDLMRRGAAGSWAVSAQIGDAPTETRLGVGATPPSRARAVRIDGKPSPASRLSAHLRILWLTPAMDRLFTDAPADRRRFLDRIALAHFPDHARASSVYERAMKQRMRALRDGVRDDAWLSALEQDMAAAGAEIARARRETAARLAAAVARRTESPFPSCLLRLQGDLETRLEEGAEEEVRAWFSAKLKANRRCDAEAGRALFGPHRSDFSAQFAAGGADARQCSTGEQKALLISLILANARLLSEAADAPPLIVLLDEIAAHLDESRRAELFDELALLRAQIWMSGADRADFAAVETRAQIVAVELGGSPKTLN